MVKVITYGTYDMFHYGHRRLLERAKALGDYLIVGVTSDDYDKTRGKINNQQSLMERIAAVRETGIADEYVTMKLGAPLMSIDVGASDRNAFKLAVYDMLLLADEIAIQMGNDDLRKMANIEMVKTYLSEIYDKFSSNEFND